MVFSNITLHNASGATKVKTIPPNANIFIRGDNLTAMHELLSDYKKCIKLIYIDPPYNTGSSNFLYRDSLPRNTWLTFMEERLEVAKKLLRDDGVVFVQCDDNEQAYLKILLDKIFGEENFVNCIAVKMSEATGVKMAHAMRRFPKIKEYLLFYKNPQFKGFTTIDKVSDNCWDEQNNIFLDGLTLEIRQKLDNYKEKSQITKTDLKQINSLLKNVKRIPLSQKLKEIPTSEIDSWKFENAYRIIKTAGSTALLNIVKNLPSLPKQELAAALSKSGVLFYYIPDFNRDARDPRLRVIFADQNLFKHPCDFWQDIKTSGAIANEGGVAFNNGKKPEKLMKRIIKMTTTPGDIVLDFFAGSGTTLAVAHKMGRRWIGIEQNDYGANDPIVRLTNVINGEQSGISTDQDVNWKGGGSYISCSIK